MIYAVRLPNGELRQWFYEDPDEALACAAREIEHISALRSYGRWASSTLDKTIADVMRRLGYEAVVVDLVPRKAKP